ncbi:hypothetical protein RCC89_18050 [Cytophagaceae bacterium ABcell3]|nr:hypothetical protein RCC89_18050 [Cytophagaceae bacterium ABcell3]
MRNFLLFLALLISLGTILAIIFYEEGGANDIIEANIVQNEEVYEPLQPRDVYTVAFYNLENLFDIYDDPHTNDNQFLPDGSKKWTEEKYQKKLDDLSKVIYQLGDDDGPEIMGICEVENLQVMEDLIGTELLSEYNYDIVHYDSPDVRGIDVGLIYKKDAFKPFYSNAYAVKDFVKTRMRTRDILVVGGVVGMDSIFVFVNHWPSRIGGKEATEVKRVTVAEIVKSLKDSLYQQFPNADYLIMGDFNDEPADTSILHVLGASKDQEGRLFNPYYALAKEGRGTSTYRRNWFMLDQIILSTSMLDVEKSGLNFQPGNGHADIYNPEWLYHKKDPSKGPFRTYAGNKYQGGFSDHFPVYINFSLN